MPALAFICWRICAWLVASSFSGVHPFGTLPQLFTVSCSMLLSFSSLPKTSSSSILSLITENSLPESFENCKHYFKKIKKLFCLFCLTRNASRAGRRPLHVKSFFHFLEEKTRPLSRTRSVMRYATTRTKWRLAPPKSFRNYLAYLFHLTF